MRKFTFILLTGALLLFTGCKSEKRHNYIILLDNSESINQMADKYLDIIMNTIVLNLGRHDRLTIQFIDECVMTKAERIYSIDLDKFDFSLPGDGLNHKEDSIKFRLNRFLSDSVKSAIESQIKQKRQQRIDCDGFTDIVNALNGITSLLTKEKSFVNLIGETVNSAEGIENYKFENVLIIFSDMIQENREHTLDFTKMGVMNEKQVAQKIGLVQNLKKIPNLNACKVFVYGVTSSSNAGILANKQIENVHLFWEDYFQDSNAKLLAYSFDCQKEIVDFMASSRN
jgi:hypothetical protein